MKNLLSEIRQLYVDERYDDAFRLADNSEQSGTVNPALLVWKQRSFLLAEHPTADLDKVEYWLRQALELDDEYLPALELGYFYLNVMDDSLRALPMFERARQLVTEHATDTVIGISECISETDSAVAALEFLEQENLVIDISKLAELKAELKERVDTFKNQSH